MIVGLLRVKNEARWIGRSLHSLREVCDKIVVMDDHSTDETPHICRAMDKVAVFHSPFNGLDETRDKNWLLDRARLLFALESIEHGKTESWVLMIDGDEVLAPGAAQSIALATHMSGGAPCYSLEILYLWDREDQIRIDGVYGRFRRPSLFRPGASHFQTTNAGGNFHCGNAPLSLQRQAQPLDAALLHFGYLYREDRLRKYRWYNAADPRNAFEDGYRHMVQGDVPEVPAAARLRHAGPLLLRQLA